MRLFAKNVKKYKKNALGECPKNEYRMGDNGNTNFKNGVLRFCTLLEKVQLNSKKCVGVKKLKKNKKSFKDRK